MAFSTLGCLYIAADTCASGQDGKHVKDPHNKIKIVEDGSHYAVVAISGPAKIAHTPVLDLLSNQKINLFTRNGLKSIGHSVQQLWLQDIVTCNCWKSEREKHAYEKSSLTILVATSPHEVSLLNGTADKICIQNLDLGHITVFGSFDSKSRIHSMRETAQRIYPAIIPGFFPEVFDVACKDYPTTIRFPIDAVSWRDNFTPQQKRYNSFEELEHAFTSIMK